MKASIGLPQVAHNAEPFRRWPSLTNTVGLSSVISFPQMSHLVMVIGKGTIISGGG